MFESTMRNPPNTSLIVTSSILLGCSLALTACVESGDPELSAQSEPAAGQDLNFEGEQQIPASEKAQSIPVEDLPFVEAIDTVETFVQLLPQPTESGENVAVHVKLPPPVNPELNESLVRVVGDPENPLVLFRSDALVELGQLESSPGPEFFTAFVVFDNEELDRRKQAEDTFAESKNPSETTLVFKGRTPIAITTGLSFDFDKFFGGQPIALGPCPIMPTSELARWNESLMITNLTVVQDAARTHDACIGGGNPDGVWTFKHLMEEMATGSGLSTHDFVVDWLEHWLNDYTVNTDTIPARVNMFSQVIQPWATASGVTATLGPGNTLILSGDLDLDISPFRLSAIVNRLDLGGTTSGPSGYGGASTSTPTDAGELRFVFGVQNLDTCNVMRFSVIFEYGVPITGCGNVRDWAFEWTKLNDPAFAAPFSAAWRQHLEDLTEQVVVHGAAPGRGNDNALNNLRTNENGLNFQWEFRNFTLTIEDPIADTDTPANGPLRPHTVAMTPDDTDFHPTPNGTVDDFVVNQVLPTVPPLSVPSDCEASFTVPGQYLGDPFRGGNSFTASAGPTHWSASVNPANLQELCARHQFSVNTCNGCHFDDTATFFLHVDPTVSPAGLSNFLTGGVSGIWSVPDSQFGTPNWDFRDLDRRFNRLYEVACAPCGGSLGIKFDFLDVIAEIGGVVPIDPVVKIDFPHQIGPIVKIDAVAELLSARGSFIDPKAVTDVELGELVRRIDPMVH